MTSRAVRDSQRRLTSYPHRTPLSSCRANRLAVGEANFLENVRRLRESSALAGVFAATQESKFRVRVGQIYVRSIEVNGVGTRTSDRCVVVIKVGPNSCISVTVPKTRRPSRTRLDKKSKEETNNELHYLSLCPLSLFHSHLPLSLSPSSLVLSLARSRVAQIRSFVRNNPRLVACACARVVRENARVLRAIVRSCVHTYGREYTRPPSYTFSFLPSVCDSTCVWVP